MTPQDPALVDWLRAHARDALSRVRHDCLGLERDDLVAAGWLAYARAWDRAAGTDTQLAYASVAALRAMRFAVVSWVYDRRSVPVLQHPALEALPVAEPDPESSALDLWREPLRALVAKVRPRRRRVIEAIYFDGLTPAETAAALAEPIAYVHKARYQTVNQLARWAA